MKSLDLNRIAIRTGILISAMVVLALVVVSPIALQWLARIHGVNWMRLSNVAQTYGAVSALLTALALGGVIISLIYQARDVKAARAQGQRTFHNDLLKMEMEDPIYMDVMAAPFSLKAGLSDYDSLRQNHLAHMWVSYWESQYDLREMPDPVLRILAANELFVSSAGRRYWSLSRDDKLKYYKGRRRRCATIMDEEYNRAVASGPPVKTTLRSRPDNVSTAPRQQMSPAESKILICAIAGAAIIAGHLLGRGFSRSSR